MFVLFLAGCAGVSDSPRRAAVSWEELPGWRADDHATALPVFLRSCEKLRGEKWRAACAAAARLSSGDGDSARRFFEEYFSPHQLLDENGGSEGLITGYYEPLLRGATAKSARYPYPIYARPADLLTVSLGELYPELKNRRVRGRVSGGEVVPYYSRAEIDGGGAPLAGGEILWVDDKYALFFLHIQGSGLVRLPDGRIIGVGYRDQNGHPYRSIGRLLIARGEMTAAEVNLFSLREWLEKNPSRADALLHDNPSYVFFSRRDEIGIGPRGATGVMLTPERSLAADFSVVPRGAPVWLDAKTPDDGEPLQRLMFAQDSGGAIKGAVRADFFWGRGERAEKMAGLMKERGRLFVLLPR
ncbi:MAG: murein transglycosylase A [Gammaproteobacteria bacterium]